MSEVQHGKVVFRHWGERGLQEQTAQFQTLDELFELFLRKNTEHGNQFLVDRVLITGTGDDDRTRHITLVFQSMTISEAPDDTKPDH